MLTRHEVEKLLYDMHDELHASSQAVWVCVAMIVLALGLIWAGLAAADAGAAPENTGESQWHVTEPGRTRHA